MDETLQNNDPQTNESKENIPYNMVICPNCMEPNTEDLANCRYCGQPLHPRDEYETPSVPLISEEETLPAEPEKAPEELKAEKDTQRKKTLSDVLKYFGVYVIFMGADQLFTVLKNDGPDKKLGIIASVIYIVAGIMLTLPLFKDLKQYLAKKASEKSSAVKANTSETLEGNDNGSEKAE